MITYLFKQHSSHILFYLTSIAMKSHNHAQHFLTFLVSDFFFPSTSKRSIESLIPDAITGFTKFLNPVCVMYFL